VATGSVEIGAGGAGRFRQRSDSVLYLAGYRARMPSWQGRFAKSILTVGLRGVGKTVLLDRMRDDAEASGRSRRQRAKSYAGHLFDFPVVGALPAAAARIAIAKPVT
jgi:hypothetical protein